MAAPSDDIDSFRDKVIPGICTQLISGSGNVLVHCRGGVGRAGLVACCVLAELVEFKNYKKVIEFVRKRRDKRCIESRKQEDFVALYCSKLI